MRDNIQGSTEPASGDECANSRGIFTTLHSIGASILDELGDPEPNSRDSSLTPGIAASQIEEANKDNHCRSQDATGPEFPWIVELPFYT